MVCGVLIRQGGRHHRAAWLQHLFEELLNAALCTRRLMLEEEVK
jgi:hypothetical protein